MPVHTKYTADNSQQLAAEARLADSASKLSQKYKDTAKSANEMERAAKKAFTESLTPLQRYQQQMASLDALLKKGRITQEQYAAAVTKVSNKLEEQQRRSTLASRVMNSNTARQIAQWGSIATAIGLANKELMDHAMLQEKAVALTNSVAAAQEGLLANFGLKVSSERRESALKDVSQMSRDMGFNEAQFTTQFGKTFSATSGSFEDRYKLVREVLEAAAPLHRGNQEALGDFSGTVIDTMKSMPGASAKEAVAFLLSLQEQARITSTDKLKEFVPALAAVDVTSGGAGVDKLANAKAAGALFAAAGGRLGDPEGAETKTLLANLAAVLREMVPDDDGKPDSFEERIRKVVASKALQEQVIPELRGRGATKPVVEELLRGGRVFADWEASLDNFSTSVNDTNRLIEDARGITPELEQSTKSKEVGSTLAQRLKERWGEAGTVSQLLFSGGVDSQGGAFPGLFEMQGRGLFGSQKWLEQTWFNERVAMGADPIEQGIKALESMKAHQIPIGVHPFRRDEYLEQNPVARANIDRADEMIEELKGLRKDARDNQKNQRMQRKSKAVTPQP
jgi:AraC-like DNA-binding protein